MRVKYNLLNMNKTARINFVDERIVCGLSELSIADRQYLEGNGFVVWKADNTIFTNRDCTCLLLLTVKLNELGFKVVLG